MKYLVMVTVLMWFGISQAQDTSTQVSPATPSAGVEEGRPSKEQRKAMKEELSDERDAVNTACSEEAKAAGCADKSVGRGLLKCIRQHKMASKDFKISEGCKNSMKSLRAERKKIKNN